MVHAGRGGAGAPAWEHGVSNTPHANRTRNFYNNKEEWHHEQMSLKLLRSIFKKVDYKAHGLCEEDINFIELCITGLPPGKAWPDNINRAPEKRFLVDIVANKRHGIDVDKLDYFLRDSLGVYGRAEVNIHFPRLLSACKVLAFEGEYQICYEEKLALNLGDIFAVRAKLHKYAYQHRIVKITDYMVSDALTFANQHFRIVSRDANSGEVKSLRISDCVDDNAAFIKLGDWIINGIAASEKEALRPAQEILARLARRELYAIAGTATLNSIHSCSHMIQEDQVKLEVVEYLCQQDDVVSEVLELVEEGRPREEEEALLRSYRADVHPPPIFSANDSETDWSLFPKRAPNHFSPTPHAVPTANDDTASSATPIPVTAADRQEAREALNRTIIVSFTTINYGSSDSQGRPDDPINKVTFYNPKTLSKGAFRLPCNRVSPLFSPSAFCEVSILVLVRDKVFLEKVSESFDHWKTHNQRFLSVAVPTNNNQEDFHHHDHTNSGTRGKGRARHGNTAHPSQPTTTTSEKRTTDTQPEVVRSSSSVHIVTPVKRPRTGEASEERTGTETGETQFYIVNDKGEQIPVYLRK
ncbi:hypothetical protein AGDE_16044 [Angomonas deanei]|uniref:Uncharacterized protein n=1 Tax=Angomonas deanei TaxID=59799 RepID=A0A7G2CFP1_9TRYP|nr:hypothetical protein AGDE_16044 [Angomonas deanei]CAD2218165.1 hypothetical protein, conserved [Angomonas deanei]|eukprot:EPY17841.1 hypothetical protein AGDE_16044 [Angomonas deanei]